MMFCCFFYVYVLAHTMKSVFPISLAKGSHMTKADINGLEMYLAFSGRSLKSHEEVMDV